jgi:hypothetical protein
VPGDVCDQQGVFTGTQPSLQGVDKGTQPSIQKALRDDLVKFFVQIAATDHLWQSHEDSTPGAFCAFAVLP